MASVDNLELNRIIDTAAMVTRNKSSGVEKYFESLGEWPALGHPGTHSGPPGPPEDHDRTDDKGDTKTYSCTTTPYDITTNPDKIVMFSPDLSSLWPGALVQGKTYQQGIGSLQELPIRKRAPLKLIVTLLTTPNTKIIMSPDARSVEEGIAELISPLEGKSDFGSSISFHMTETYSAQQALMALGFSASFAGTSFMATHSEKSSETKSVVTASLIQNVFTAYIENPSTPAAFFSADLTLGDLFEQERLGRIGKNNIPVFVGSVSYGRMLYVTISSDRSFSDIKTALSASVNVDGATAGGSFTQEQQMILEQSTMSVTGIGIEDKAAAALIRTGTVQKFFSAPMDMRSVRPISYMFYNLRDLTIAGLTDTAHYNITVCQPKVVANPSQAVADHAGAVQQHLLNFNTNIRFAVGNSADRGESSLRMQYAGWDHNYIVDNLNWLRTNVGAFSGDDKTWLKNWIPGILDQIEQMWRSEKLGHDQNTDWTVNAVYLPALNDTNSQRAMAVAVSQALNA